MRRRRPAAAEARVGGALWLVAGFGAIAAGCSSGTPAGDAPDAEDAGAATEAEDPAGAGVAADRGGRSARQSASYPVTDLEGNEVGTLELEDGGRGLLLRVRITGLSPGGHGFHLHETGRCEPPFESARGHHAPLGRTHGFLTDDGPHVGDLPNLQVAEGEGQTVAHAYAAELRLADLLDEDGSAMIVHAGPDDYLTDPAGAAGDRVACAAITRD